MKCNKKKHGYLPGEGIAEGIDNRDEIIRNLQERLNQTIVFLERAVAVGKQFEKKVQQKEKEITKLSGEFNPCSVCTLECPFHRLGYETKLMICLEADSIKKEFYDELNKLKTSEFIRGNKHLYQWAQKPIELPEKHQNWLISLNAHLSAHSN